MGRGKILAFWLLFFLSVPIWAQIRVDSPNVGGNWALGSAMRIRWIAPGVSGFVRITVVMGPEQKGVIAASVPASAGSLLWTVGRQPSDPPGVLSIPAGYGYRVRIISLSTGAADESDVDFNITPGAPSPSAKATSVRVVEPNGGGTLYADETLYVRWTVSNPRPGQMVNVTAVRYGESCGAPGADDGHIILPITRGETTYRFAEGPLRSTFFKVKLLPVAPDVFAPDESDNCFSVRGVPVVRVLYPNGKESFRPGDTVTIRWEAENLSPGARFYVAVSYYTDDCRAMDLMRRIGEFSSATRSCRWTVRSDAILDLSHTMYHRIVINVKYNPRFVSDQSDDCFVIR